MNKKRTKAIRNFLALLVLLTIGGTQQVWADGTLDDINTHLTIDPSDRSKGTAVATSYQSEPNGHCELLKVVLKVTPKPGYYTNLDLITATNGETTPTVYGKYVGDDIKTVDPSEPTKNYSAEREIVIYWDNYASPNAIQITVTFKKAQLQLACNLGKSDYDADVDRVTAKFFDGGTDAPTAETFDPTAYPDANAIEEIDNSDGNDHYIIVHIVPNPGYWTDRTLLMAYEAGGALARSRAPIVDPVFYPTLLQADTYVDAESNTKPRHDGAGWYYYKLPKEHNCTAGYKYSIINGFAPKKFYLNGSNVWNPTSKVLTVTDGTTNGWSVEFTYDKVSYPFDGNPHRPTLAKLTVKYNGEKAIEFDGSTAEGRAAIDNQVVNGDGNDDCIIRDSHTINTNAAQPYPYCWFISGDYDAKFAITVPFSGSGTEADPWLIKGGADLTLLSKCVNIGYYPFADQFIVLDENYDYDVAADYAEFEPIGMKGEVYNTPFCGIFNGKGKTISGINYTFTPGMILGDLGPVNSIGLFGQLGDVNSEPIGVGVVKNVKLENCTFGTDYDGACFVGGIAGNIDRGGIYGSTVSSSTVSASDANSHTGAIFGHKNAANVELENNHYTFYTKVSLGSGTSVTTASGYTKRGGFIGTAWDDITDNDGAMLYVKKATIGGTSTNGSAVTFNEVKKGFDRYDKDGDDFYYAVGQPITLSVTLKNRTEATDIRTFYDELNALTMNDGTTDTDIKDALGFTMPEADATVTATIDESKWFTIPSNNKNWMSFYHEWKDASGASANYIVTDGDGTGKTIEVKTVASVDPDAGTFTLADIQGGVSFCEMPTLFHYADKNDDTAVLPALLKFTPVDPNVNYTQPDKANQFKGTDTGKELAPSDKCYVLNNMGDFIFAYVVTDVDDKIPAHHCYIDLVDNPHFARLLKVAGDATGIDTILRDDSNAVGAWYSLDGRRLDRQPAKKGLYIHKGKKAVIK